jgi:LacI family transcriptional regulator
MRQNITLKHIALKVGLSVATVSRVLNGKSAKYRISKRTQALIQKAARDLNYSPNQLARSLRLNRSNTIAYINPDISNPFFASIGKSIVKYARKSGYSIVLGDSEENTEMEMSLIQTMLEHKVDGLIISPVGVKSSHLVELYNKRIPIVLIDRYFPGVNLPYVTSDNYTGALEAVSLLIENGHTRIACIQGLKNTSPNNDRVKGYIDALKKHNIPIDNDLIRGDSFGEENGYIETKLLLERRNIPTAIFAISNLISLGALRALKEGNYNVPNDMSVISFDEQPYSQFLATPMTTVSQQSFQIGQIAAKLMIDQIDSKKNPDPQSILLPTRIMVRSSVKPRNKLKLKVHSG